LLTGCERRFFHSHGALTSDGGQLAAWSRPVQGCSADPLDGLPQGKTSTLFTLYWGNSVDRDLIKKRNPPPRTNQPQNLIVRRGANGPEGLLKTTKRESGTMLDATVCSAFEATTTAGHPVIAGGRPTVDGTLNLNCRVAGSHLTASVTFSGCEY
jgi:hypothetical protein